MILSLANTGSPLVVGGFLGLLIANLLFGIVEGAIIRRAVDGKGPVITVVMIVANYVSMGAGYIGIAWLGALIFTHLRGNDLRLFFWLMMATYIAMFVVTCLIEYPIVMWMRNGLTHRKFAPVFLRAQLTTNIALLLFCGWSGPRYLFHGMHLEARPDFLKPVAATLYYLNRDGSAVRAMRLDTRETSVALPLSSPPRETSLSVLEIPPDYVIVAAAGIPESTHMALDKSYYQERGEVLRIPMGSPQRLVPPGMESRRFWRSWRGTRGTGVDWRPPLERSAERRGIATGVTWLHVDDSGVRIDNPFVGLYTEYATVLPTGQAIFSLSDKYIMLLDIESKRVAILTRGRDPIIVLDEAIAPKGS